MKLDILAIAAHPDDVELACAATMGKLSRSGKLTGILDLTQGERGTRGSKEIRRQEAEEAGKVLGLSFRHNCELPDGGIEQTPENLKMVIRHIRALRPEVLIFPHWLERHPDHEHTHRLAREAWFYAGLEKLVTLVDGIPQEPWRPKRFYHFMQKFEFVPSFIVDVSDCYDLKEQALSCFRSQFYDPASSERETLLSSRRFLDSVRARDMHHGSLINKEFGEPFYSIEPLGVDSFFSLTL
jgi:N-acetylglucosamine malate deacetylase 1